MFLYCLVPVFEEDVFVVVVLGSRIVGLFSFTIDAVNTSIFPVRIPVVSKKSSSTQVEGREEPEVGKDQVYTKSDQVSTIAIAPEVGIIGYSLSEPVPIVSTVLVFLSNIWTKFSLRSIAPCLFISQYPKKTNQRIISRIRNLLIIVPKKKVNTILV